MSLSKAKEYAKKKGITLKDDDNKKAVTKRSQSSSVSKQERINQKMYGDKNGPSTVKKPSVPKAEKERRLSQNTTAAQRQKMGMPTQQDLQSGKQRRQQLRTNVSNAVKQATSEENKGFMQRQKSGTQTEADKRRTERMTQRRTEVAKNTGAVAKKAVMDTVSGYGQSLADVDEMAKSNRNWTTAKAQKMGIDLNDRARVSKVEQERQQSIREAREFRQELFDKQEQRQAEWDERTKNAKGLEKAWYGAVESGTGMLADTAIGAATGTGQFGALASMGLRTYGPSANQARKEGATDKEARLYGLATSAKEIGTELMFQGAGLAKAAYGKTGLSLADKSANILTKGLTGIKADAVGAGVRALGGTAEENVEELAGWMADPLIKELTYGKAVRNRMKENLRANIPQIGSDADAANVASYFSTPQFTDELTKEYAKSGMSKDKASELAAEMRDYYVAYYSGDNERLDALEEDLAAKLSGQDKLSLKSWSMDELKDTFASTTLLTLATGMPGAVTTSVKGNQIFDSDEVKAVFGNDAVRKVADAVKNTSNKEMSLKAETMKDRLDSGKDLTGTQKYDLYQGYLEKVNETAKKARASYGVVENAREEQDLVPTMGRDRTGNTVYAKETQREYNEKFASTELTVEAIKNYMESDNSISDDEARRANAVKKAVADIHVGGLTVGDAHEFAYGNDLAREALKAEEGIDLDQYIVRKSDGTVDLAATNEETENALFQINADNAIRAAQAETEVFIDDTRGNIDKDVLTRFGNNGQAIWKEVNKGLDPRDLKNYLTTANAASYFYSAGRNTDMGVDAAINNYADTFKTVDNSVLKRAYAAGARDRIIANTPGYGQTVTSGSNIQLKKTKPIITGQLIMDKDVVIPDSDQSAYLALAMSTNTNIHIVSSLKSKQGVEINGMSHGNDIYLNMNAAAESNLGYVFMHEMTHQIKQYAPNEYLALENLVRDRWFNKDATGMQKAIKDRIDLYSTKGGQQLTEEEAIEEIIADAMAEAMDDPDFAAEVCEQDINLGQAILNSIREALRSIRNMFASTEFKNDRFHNSLLSYLGILDEAEKMWLNALHTARQNKADGLIADWQDKANKQNSPRLSVPDYTQEEMDADYMKAVESNDMDTAQRMVDEAAEKAMPNTKLKGRWYHGTENEFTVFNFSQGGKNGTADGYGIYLTNDPKVAESYGQRMIEGYVNVERPASALTSQTLTDIELHRLISRTVDVEAETLMYDEGYDNAGDAKKDTWISNYTNTHEAKSLDDAIDDVVKTITQFNGNDFDIIQEIMNGMGIRDYEQATAFYDILTEETGIDGFETKWGDESEMADPNTPTIALAFRSEQIKDASPVTYDDDGKPIPLSDRFDMSNEDIRFSLTPEQQQRDADYMDAVNSGNMDEAQRLVDEAAKMAGYTESLYHGTGATNINVFMGNPERMESNGLNLIKGYFSNLRGYSAEFGANVGTYYVNTDDFLYVDGVYTIDEMREWLERIGITDVEFNDQIDEANIYDWFYTWGGEYGEDLIDPWMFFNETGGNLTEKLYEAGYKGVTWAEGSAYEDDGSLNMEGQAFMPFESSLIKSAETIAYAEDGSIIPLSERFNPENDDVRYSLPTEDADGNVLSNGQMEYFKNSQARDAEGKMQVVYHTTNYGGFTIFDPSYSDDKRSLFFASNWDVSQTYGRNAFDPIDINNERFKTWDEFVAAANEAFKGYKGWDSNKPFENNAHMKLMDGANEADISIEEWMAMPHDEQLSSDYYVEMRLPYLGNPDFDWQELEYYDSDTMMLDLNGRMGKGKTVQRGYYSCYLNLENPLIVDAKGANWNRISYDPYGNETAGITVQDAIEQIESADIADYGIKNIDVEFEYNDDGFPIAVSYDIGLLGIPDEEHWEWTNYVESDSFEPNVEEYTDNGVLDNAELGIAMWTWVEDKLRNYVSDGMIDMMEQTNIDVNGELHYESFNKTGYDFIRGGNIVDVSEFTDNIDDASGKEYTVNTRDLAEIAEHYGHDGVIIRNLMDIGGASSLKGGKALSDIFIAFSSNQVKDINNENPTENPDIRYSITPEDEAKSQIAYDDAMDNSYELLAYYEQQLNVVNPETFDVTKAFREEDVVRFLDALKAEDSVPSDDPKFEEDRVRMAKSKEEFFNSVNARWNDRWITEGEVLKISSVKRAITNLVKGAMANSNSDAQYRNEVVKKTLVDARLAYQLMKQDRTELASYLLYHSAQRMMDGLEFIRDDTAFKEYQGIRDFLRTYRINAPEEFWENEPFLDFRKEYYGRLRIGKGNSNIEDVYQDLQDRWPHLFNEAEREKADLKSKPWDLLQHIGVVVDSNVTPFMEAYSSEEAASLATDLADQLYEIIANGDREVSLADSYKERFDAKTKAMKARHAEAILRERKIREEGIKKERIKFREYKETQKEKTLHTKYFTNIKSKYDELTKRLLTNTKEKHIPEQYKRELAELLKAFDFQTVGSKKREERTGYKAQNTIKLEAMRTALERIEANSQLFHINDSITEIMKDLLGLNEASMNKQSIEGKTLDELNAAELKQIDKLLGFLIHEFNNYEKVKVGVKKAQAADIGHAQNDISLEHADAIGEGKDYQTPFLQSIDRIVNLDMMTPAFLFRKIDPNNEGLGLMWKEIRRSFDKYVRNTNQLNEWIEDIVGEYHDKGILWNKYGSGELSKWRSTNYAQKFDLTYGTLELTPAQMMSVACLANRTQAYDHMIGAGVVVTPVSFQAKIMYDVKKKINKSLSQKLTDADIKTIVAALTPEQRQVANKLQELMATKMADWGNEASVNVLGIKLFEDPDYFPIRSDKKGLTKDLDPNQFEQAIRNFGFTKAVQPGARNAIMIDDIFDVVTEHCNNMNLYNSYTEAMNDFMKVYNYREVREDGEYTVEQALSHAFSEKAPMFIMQFIRDLNGNVSGRASGIESLYNALLANAKKASVFANFRVAAQQPTAISRAFYVIDEKYIKGIKVDKDTMTEMFEHCPIALWKSWGYYDINMGKSIEDVIMNNGRWLEDKATDLYGKLDNVTWTAIWQMVKAETKDLHPELKEGSDEFFEHCNERMSEIVDLTQVVDSPMHRSHAMRDKGFFKKMTTAFMAEPTLTFNMLRDGVTRTSEAYKRGKKKLASQILSRTIGVYLLQSVMVAGAQSLVDALRGKKPDKDDDDDRFLHLWWVNFVEDWKDEFNPLGKIYVVKDIKSMMDGWESRNLALQGVYYLSLGYRQLTGNPYARSSKSWYENMLYGLGYLTGVPAKTMLTGTSNAKRMLGVETPILDDYLEFLDSFAKAKQDDESDGNIFGNSIGELLRQSMDAAAEMMGYKPIEDKGELQLAKKKPKEGLLARMGIGRTEEEKEQDAFDKKTQDIADKYADLSGEERDKKVWSSVTTYLKEQNEDKGVADMVTNGDYATINKYRQMYIAAGGGEEYFDERVLAESKKALKKSIKYDQTDSEIIAQEKIKDYVLNHGMTEDELSDIVYHSETARDLKVAFRLNDKDLMMESLEPLVNAGLTYSDLQRLWDNRNKMQLSSYKGRYKDKLKSTGKFIWPTDGVITSHFGYRNAPTAGASSNHPAIDIGAPQGTAVVAADGGIVISAGANGGYGNSVGIKHDNGMITWYNHLYSWNVKEGDTVAQGQQIAQVGSTGISTGPHLDFKIMDTNGNPVDPEKYLGK